jgi:trigger factor
MIIDQRVGRETVLIEAVNDALPALYMKALDDNNLTPLSQPQLEMDDIEDGAAVKFRAELDIAPKIELPEFHGLEAEVEVLSVEDADVDEQLDNLRQRFGSLNPVERPAASGDFVTIDLSAAKDGEPISEAQATGMSYQVGRGTMLEGLDESLEGMSAGDEKTFSSTLVGGEYRDQLVDVTVAVTAVKEQELPELDDEFAQLASEFDTAEELTVDVRTRLGNGKRLEQAAAARDAVLEKLLEMVEVPLPETVVADELTERRSSVEQQLAYAGIPLEKYLEDEGQTQEEFEADLERRVRDAVAAQFVLDKVANELELGVDQQELTEHMVRRAQQSGQDPQEFANHMFEHNHIPELVGEIRRGKALARLVEGATVTDASGNVVDLKNLRPDGTIGDPAEGAVDQGEVPGASTGASMGETSA